MKHDLTRKRSSVRTVISLVIGLSITGLLVSNGGCNGGPPLCTACRCSCACVDGSGFGGGCIEACQYACGD
jgi:hypothetical protein